MSFKRKINHSVLSSQKLVKEQRSHLELQCTISELGASKGNCIFMRKWRPCDVGSGAVLLQEDLEGNDHPVCYFS